ncbi:MAG: hypothetical protein LBU85_06190 [Treponema sp.]|jgi:hypothetical protein|nr:hypothetical protein [Treponema sp.]
MKKAFFIFAPVLFAMLAGSCDEIETNYTDEGHYGHIIIHNEAGSGKNITHIVIESDSGYWNESTYYDDSVNITPGNSSDAYELELSWSWVFSRWNGYQVTITAGGTNLSAKKILSYEDIVNHLYYDGTKLEERK